MKKTLCLLAILFSTMLSAQESKLTIDHINNWVIYGTDGVQYCMLGWEKKIVGDITYILEFEGKYGYRQESDKVYRYNLAGNKEQLVLDYSLQVGDVFPLCEGFSLQVESVSDTTLINEWMEERLCKRIELRGVEQPSYQDVWVESFGSVRYGINPPTEAEDFSHTYLMYATSWDFNFTCNLNLSGAWGMVAPLGEEYPLANEEYLEYDPVEFTLRNDTLHIGGYLRNDCAGPLYMFVEEKADKIFLSTYELPEDADCYSFFKIDVNITGLSKDKYTIVYQGKTFETIVAMEESKPYLVTEGKEWAVERYTMGGVQGVYSYCLQGDTIINGKEYKIEHEGCGKDLSGMKPSGRYMREENGRVYSYAHTERYKDEDEVLFFDFNLEDGDTIVYIPDVYSLHVMDVYDAVVPHSDGQSRKCYEVELWNIREEGVYDSDDFGGTFVEGIGNLCSGLSDPGFGLVGSNQRLLYVKQGDTILYQREEENPKEQSKFFADDTKWYGEEDYVYYSSHHRTSISYSLGTDTVIDGQLGQTLYRDGEYQGTFFVKGESVWFKPSTIFSWFINIEEEEELPTFLLYDFSLQVGDTIFYDERSLGYTYEKTEEYSPNLVVKAVREVHGRKVIDFDDGEQWIEGIGSIREPFLERWRPRLVGPGNTYESIYQVVADSATIWFKGELANPNIEPWLKAGMTWTENKQYNEGEDYVSHQIKLGKGSLPGRFSVSITGMDPWEKPFYELQVFNNKVYGLGMNSIILCYDFSLSVGNKVSLLKSYNYGLDNCYYYYDNCHVTKVDTVVYYGVPRKRIILSGDRDDVWVEGIGSLTRLFPLDNLDTGGDYSIMANYSKVVECSYKGNLLYRKDDLEITRPTIKRGYGLYHSDSYLYAYTMDEAAGVTDSTDFARWNDRTVIRIDVDTIGPNAFSGATFRQGQIICFTERLNTIFKDAFTGINILPRSTQDASLADDLTLVFEGNRPPLIDKNQILDYADSTCRINYAVPDIATYVASDIQWTYTTLMTIEDLLRGQISPENEITVSDSTEVNVDASEDNTNTGGLVVVVEARPRKDIPIRIGDGENKDIYSRAPAWQRYTMELKITDSRETVLFEDAQECDAEEGCVFEVVLSAYPEDGVVYLHSRSTDMFNRSTEWMVQKASLYRNGEEDCYFTDVNVNLDKHGAEEKLTATITDDSIRITGYYLSNCAGELTCEAYAKIDEIALVFYDEPLVNCVGIHYVDFTIPLLITPVEAIYVVASYDQSVLMEVEILPEGAAGKLVLSGKDAPYYDLQGRPVAHPTRGVYIRNGKKVIL